MLEGILAAAASSVLTRANRPSQADSLLEFRLMTGRAIRITARILFVLCGLISLITGAPYVMLRGIDLPVQSEWVIFAVILGLTGFLSVVIGLLPRSWIAKTCKRDRDDTFLYSAPLKVLGGFAATFYLAAAVAYLAPHRWDLDPQFMLAMCPLYFVKMNFDPSLVAVFFVLAPMNAAVYGSLGLSVGYVWLAFGRRRRA